jgi:hypothetical protein
MVGIDGLIAEGDVDVVVAGDDLGDVGGRPARIASVMNMQRKSCGVKVSGWPATPWQLAALGGWSPVSTSAYLGNQKLAK